MPSLSVAIVAGGRSSRMGRDKSFVLLRGKPMIEHVVARVSALPAESMLLIANRPDDYAYLGLPTYPDVFPDKGSLGGIFSAVHHSPSEHTLVVGCDMPYLSDALLRYMASLLGERADPYDVIVPVHDNHPQGLHAIYRKTCLAPIRADLEADRLKVIGFFGAVSVRYIQPAEYRDLDPGGRSFQNINTPEELERANQGQL
ncbi:MAG: molybdenum cofactor guanylyltransferase [Anaerolineae bacterium]|nr:molybdenum cofactor guanylyltransferase [Anaerolineae bacterium]